MAIHSSIVDAIRFNRREFLQGLTAVGAVVSLPVSLAEATTVQVNEAWTTLVEDPWLFDVNDYGTLVESMVGEPKLRGDVFRFVARRPPTPNALIGEVEGCQPLLQVFQRHASAAAESLEHQRQAGKAVHPNLDALIEALYDEDEGWIAWILHEGEAGMPRFHEIIDQWLDSPVDWDEYDWFPSDWSGQGRAYRFFRGMKPEVLAALGVVIVEGDHPGSDYFAAELCSSIDEVNAVAENLGLPFRFRPEEVPI